jgi:hypothetical protein
VALDQLIERPIRDERPVAVYHEEHTLSLALERPKGRADRIPGAELLPLEHGLGVLGEYLLYQPGLVAHDDQEPLGREGPDGLDHVVDHRHAAQGVEHLRPVRLHPGPFAGSEDHGEDRRQSLSLGHGFRRTP